MSRSLGLAGGLALAFVVASVVPAAAAPIVNEHFHASESEVFDDFCEDMAVLFQHEADIHELVKSRGPYGLIYFAANVRFVNSWTNLATGKTFAIEGTIRDMDQRVTDNGDGTLTILIKSAGKQKVYGPDGERLFLDAGIFSFEILVDHSGTPTDPSDDEFLDDLGVVKVTGRVDTAERDFCEDFREFTS
ncbi:MAG TPA: hypothetical protein VK585_17330 [Jiangellaceae bacterium]|nr:hypothetical protein [Jiangellaceae bacterium]